MGDIKETNLEYRQQFISAFCHALEKEKSVTVLKSSHSDSSEVSLWAIKKAIMASLCGHHSFMSHSRAVGG